MIERDNIGIFGKMNSGKSSLMNLLTQQETSIVDSTPGTTADTKIALLEIHGIGPVKIFDTAGLDEVGELGEKKKQKVFSNLKESDLVLIVIDSTSESFEIENEVIDKARELDKQIIIVWNLFDEDKVANVEGKITLSKFYPKITLKANDDSYRQEVLNFVINNFESKNKKVELLPFLEKHNHYMLNIPMDVETPPGRYLRPQAMTEEYITRNWAYPSSFRMDLGKAREGSFEEKERFNAFVKRIGPKCIITDSQAMDIMKDWCPDNVMMTTFSIVMINYFSRGRLMEFVKGIDALDSLVEGDKVLIVEACNHSRIGEDIGIKQIPDIFEKKYPGVKLEHNFGREFQENENLKDYKLIIHCGGCMISAQKLQARIRDLEAIGVPFTNYGVFLSHIYGGLSKVLEPWKK